MRKFILALVALTAMIAPVALVAAPADAAVAKKHHAKKHHAKHHHAKKHHKKKHHKKKHAKKNTACMTKGEWYRLSKGMTRRQVKNVVGSWGKVTDRVDNSDGTFYLSVDYRQCNGSTTYVAFETEVTYGAYVWDSCKDISDYSGNCIGGEVWDEWEETGITYTPRATYVGSYYS
jgi:Ni/Co efflux regulator RcnB